MFAERLKSLRKEAGLTQKQVAEHFDIKQPSYAQWEQGKRNPSDETLKRFAQFFDVSTDYLLGKTDIKNHSTIDEAKLDEAISNSLGYNGKPPTEEEKANMKEVLLKYFESLGN